MKKTVWGLAATAALMGAPALAGTFLPDYTGYSGLKQGCTLCDSTVNFAVYQNDGNWLSDLGVSSNAVDLIPGTTGAELFVYMYQVMNTNNNTGPDEEIQDFNIAVNPGLVDSVGYLNSVVFTDVAGNTVNYNTDITLADPDEAETDLEDLIPGNRTPEIAGLSPVGLAGDPGGTNPDGAQFTLISSIPVGATGVPGLNFSWDFGNTIPLGGFSPVLFFTSDHEPDYTWADTRSAGGTGAAGDVPAPVPVPAALPLLASAFGILGFMRMRRNKA